MILVTITALDDLAVVGAYGPFEGVKPAMDWADQDSILRSMEDIKFTRQSDEESIMIADFADVDDNRGYLYQVIEVTAPITAGEHEPCEST